MPVSVSLREKAGRIPRARRSSGTPRQDTSSPLSLVSFSCCHVCSSAPRTCGLAGLGQGDAKAGTVRLPLSMRNPASKGTQVSSTQS